MSLYEAICKYIPVNEQEESDKKQMLQFIKENTNYLERANQIGHFTASMWTVNPERTKTLMIYHNVYHSWSWVGGHVKKGVWVPSHLHFNLTYLAEADEAEELRIKEDENSAVKWWKNEDALKASTEPWMVDNIYRKLIKKQEQYRG